MKYHVNTNCIFSGLCEGICPEIFRIVDSVTALSADLDT